jgi:hypothetical protein
MRVRRVGIAAVAAAAVVVASMLLVSNSASAAPMDVTISFAASGTIGGAPFTNAATTITSHLDTAARVLFAPGIYDSASTLATIDIAGIGSSTFIDATVIFVNNNNSNAGFSRSSPSLSDVVVTDSPAFATWDLLTAVGPVDPTRGLIQVVGVSTSRGTLLLSDYSSGTFQAVVPEPTSLCCVALFIGTTAALRRRRARRQRRGPAPQR